MDRLLVASRYLLARPISLVAILVFVVAVVALVLVDSIMNGFLREHREMLRGTTPDISIRIPKGADASGRASLREDPERLDAMLESVRSTDGVESAGLRQSWPVMYKRVAGNNAISDPRGGTSHFVHLLGLDLDSKGELSDLREMCSKPVNQDAYLRPPSVDVLRPPRPEDPLWFDPGDDFWHSRVTPDEWKGFPLHPILFGEQLAVAMRLHVGQVVKVIGLGDRKDEDGYYPKRVRHFVVCGSYRSADALFEDTHAITRRSEVVAFSGTTEQADELAVTVVDEDRDDEVAATLLSVLEPYSVDAERIETWEQRKQKLLRAIHNERSIMNFVLMFVVLIAGFALLVTLSMMVNTKLREIGILLAMGSTASRIVSLFLLCGMMVALVGVVVGLGLGLLLCYFVNDVLEVLGVELFDQKFYSFGELPTEVDPGRIAVLVAATLVCALLASVVPSLRAGRLEAVDALRQE